MTLRAESMQQDWSSHFTHPSVNQTQPCICHRGACCSHKEIQRPIKMVDVCGKEHGLLNIDVTDRVGMNLIGCYSVTLLNILSILFYQNRSSVILWRENWM